MSHDRETRLREGRAIVRRVARRLARRLGPKADVDDLGSLGDLALLGCLDAFEPSLASFSTYVTRKVTWAMLDGFRRETHGRVLAARAQAVAASSRFADGGPAEADAAAGGDPTRAFRGLFAGHATALALGLASGSGEAEPPADSSVSPERRVLGAELAARVRRALEGLADVRARALVERHYFGGEAFDAIAEDLGISKSWASRLHAKALVELAAALGD